MLKRIPILLLFLLMLCGARAQGAFRWESWLDADYGKHVAGSSTGEEMNFTLPLGECAPGLHFLNFRAVNAGGEVGHLFRTLFYVPQAKVPDGTIVAYEHWVDNDYATHVAVNRSTAEPVFVRDVAELAPGVHFLNVRAVNAAGATGHLFRTLFYLPPVTPSGAAMARYEQWLDDDYSGRVAVPSSSDTPAFTVDVSALSPGLHFLNVWALNDAGATGHLFRTLFYLPEPPRPNIAEYEYWLDADTLHKRTGSEARFDYAFSLDVSALPPGDHTFSFRAKNDCGEWGPIHVDTFNVALATPVEAVEADERPFDVYNLAGIRVLRQATAADLRRLPPAIYIVRGRKIRVK